MDECDTLLGRRCHAAYGAPIEGREGFELFAILDVKYGQRGRLSGGCGIFLPLLDQRPPQHDQLDGRILGSARAAWKKAPSMPYGSPAGTSGSVAVQ